MILGLSSQEERACLNLKAEQPLFRAPPLALNINAPYYSPMKGAKVVVPNINEGRLGKPAQAAEPAVRLSTNNIGVYNSVNGVFLARC